MIGAQNGRLAAFCVCLLDASGNSQIELLGSHENHRWFGLGRAALSDSLHRMQILEEENISAEGIIAALHLSV